MTRVQQFFQRIGMDPDTQIRQDAAFLGQVQSHCVCAIAYENLDILAGKPLDLTEDALFEKIVLRGRGGYCFENNGLLACMLREMGFSVTERFARYLRGETGLPMRRHRLSVVQLDDGAYMCDIGIGQTAPRLPVRLEEGTPQVQGSEVYRFRQDPLHGWVLQERKDGQWKDYLCFADVQAFPIDFVQPSFFCEKHPDSVFNKRPMVAIKTPTGRRSLDDRCYKVFENDQLCAQEDAISDARMSALLEEVFLIGKTGI